MARPRSAAWWPVLGCVLTLLPASALAQPPVMEVTVAGVIEGPSAGGTTTATLIDPAGTPLVLFTARHRTTWAPGVETRLGIRIATAWMADLAGAWTRPALETRISGDLEAAEAATATLGMHRITVSLGLERRFRPWGRAEPYARVSAGWLREITADRVLVDDGVAAHAGGGLKYPVREGRPGWLGHVALRAEARLALRRGGITPGATGTRWSPVVMAGVVIAR